MNLHRVLTALMAMFLLGPLTLAAQEMVEESSSGKLFPKEVTFTHDTTDYTLSVTGLAVRKKLFFKVYGVAHYLEAPLKAMSEEEAYQTILSDGKAKQITMTFSRDVGGDKIQGAYRDTFEKNTSEAEFETIKPLVEQFLAYFDKEVKEDQQYILRWLPGGVVVSIVQGEEKPALTNVVFARALWSAWLGPDAVVDRDKLVKMITE